MEDSLVVQAERVAVLYRRVVLLVGAQLLCSFIGQAMAGAAEASNTPALALLGLLVIACGVVAGVAIAVSAYRLMRELGSKVAWLWALGLFVPCMNIIVLLALSSRAQSWCKERGIRVGLLGPTKDSIAELKRRSEVRRTFE